MVADASEFVKTLARAESRSAAESWDDAALLWATVVAENPVEGRYWTELGDARFHAGQECDAITAYERALDLRDGYPAETAYRIGCCHARLGDRDRALDWLQRAVAMGYRHLETARDDVDFATLRDDERFQDLFGMRATAGLSRDDGWRSDLRFLVREVKRRAYLPFRELPESRFDAAVEEIDAAIPRLTDAEVMVQFAKLLRLLGDAHAYVAAPGERADLRRSIPLRFFAFEEGLFVVAAEPEYESMLGGEVLSFDGTATADAIASVESLIGTDNKNPQWPRYMSTLTLLQTPILHALGLIDASDRVALTVRALDGGTTTTTIDADQRWSRSELRNAFPCPSGWRFFPRTLTEPVPLYLKNAGANYWYEYLPEQRLVYWQFNSVRDDPVEPLAAFAERLFAFVEDHPVEKLVLDLRWNSGGNTFLEMPILHGLIANRKINRKGRLFVIIGRKTFSAAQNGATLIERHTEAIFVGEPTGSSPTFVGESVEFQLPYSKLGANVSDLLWQSGWPMDYRRWLAPTIYTPPTFADFRLNRDPAMDAILSIREHLPGW